MRRRRRDGHIGLSTRAAAGVDHKHYQKLFVREGKTYFKEWILHLILILAAKIVFLVLGNAPSLKMIFRGGSWLDPPPKSNKKQKKMAGSCSPCLAIRSAP
jgi:hypothetical protein